MTARKKPEKRITPSKSSGSRADEVRARVAQIGISEQDVALALAAVRHRIVPSSPEIADHDLSNFQK